MTPVDWWFDDSELTKLSILKKLAPLAVVKTWVSQGDMGVTAMTTHVLSLCRISRIRYVPKQVHRCRRLTHRYRPRADYRCTVIKLNSRRVLNLIECLRHLKIKKID